MESRMEVLYYDKEDAEATMQLLNEAGVGNRTRLEESQDYMAVILYPTQEDAIRAEEHHRKLLANLAALLQDVPVSELEEDRFVTA